MASTTSPEASEVRRRGRRRLVGAIALVMLLVVFVPMILDSEPRPPRTEPALAIPPKDNAPPLPAPPVAPAKARAQATVPATEAPAPESAKVTPSGEAKASVAASKPEGKPAAAPKLEGFAVQVGAFRDEQKLAQAREKLAAAGIVHYTERLDAAGGPLTRLRAGPFPTREAAEAALARLKRSSLEGKVVPLS